MSDYVDVLAEHHRTARKKHQCQTCWRPINPGDKYLEQRNVMDGRAYTWNDFGNLESSLEEGED